MKYVGRQSDAKDVASLNPSAATDTSLDGTESIGGWKGGFIRTTVAKICAWMVTQAYTWAKPQVLQKGIAVFHDGGTTFDTSVSATNSNVDGNVLAGILRVSSARSSSSHFAIVVATPNGDLFRVDTLGNVSAASIYSAGAVAGMGGMKLGELSPTFKVKVIDTTMAATVGDVKTVAHGVGAMPIMVIPRVTDTGGVAVHPNSIFTNAQYGVSFDATNVYLRNSTGASANILSRPVSIVIFYTA